MGIESWILGLPNQSQLKIKLEQGALRLREDELYLSMEEKFRVAC
jgi:hypothetical protein